MVCETIGRARAGRDPQHARVPLRRFTPCEHRAVILQPVRLSSFTAISISSATRIPQETCWIPQETCLLAKKALVGFRKKLAKALVGFRKKLSCWTKSERRLLARADPARTFSRAGAARALFSQKKGLQLDARDYGSSRSSSDRCARRSDGRPSQAGHPGCQ